MYYSSAEIDEELKCACCKQKFLDVVKLIPSCGESICGDCYEELKENVDERGEFKCKACETSHKMPEEGFSDNKSLSRMLKRRKIEKPLSEEAKDLKKLVESLPSQMMKLESFDYLNYIHEFCDQLETEIIEEIASLIKLLNDIQEDLLKQTKEYRTRCLDSLSKRSSSQSTTAQDLEDNKRELKVFCKDVDEFYRHWNVFFNQSNVYASEIDISSALGMAKTYEKKMDAYHLKLKRSALNGQLIAFKTSHSFTGDPNPLRKLFSLSVQHEARETRIEPVAVRTLAGHFDKVCQVVFLSDCQLASCSHDATIKIWNVEDGSLLYELKDHKGSVYSLALLMNGWLVSSSSDMSIKIWDLEQRRVVRTLKGHTKSVLSLRILKNGNLASYSTDDTIRIWNPFATERNLLLTITGHRNSDWIIPFGVLSNENLVTVSRDENGDEDCILRVWNSQDGRMVKAVSTGSKEANTILVLSNDQLALSFQGSIIKIIDLTDDSKSHTKTQAHESGIAVLAQLPDGNLVSIGGERCDEASKVLVLIKIWSLPGLDLLRTIRTDHSAIINSLAFSPSGELLATGSRDTTIKLWSMN